MKQRARGIAMSQCTKDGQMFALLNVNEQVLCDIKISTLDSPFLSVYQ